MFQDAATRPVSMLAYDAFAYRKRASELCRDLDSQVRLLLAFLDSSPYSETTPRKVIEQALEVIQDSVMFNAPAYECPNQQKRRPNGSVGHRPHPVDCKACGGKRWISLNEDNQTARDHTPILPENWPRHPPSLTFRREKPKSRQSRSAREKTNTTSSLKE